MPTTLLNEKNEFVTAVLDRDTLRAMRVYGSMRVEYPEITLEEVIDRLRHRRETQSGNAQVA